MRRPSLVSRSLLAATLAVIIGGCGPGPLDPARTGGELLTGTEDEGLFVEALTRR